MRLLVLAAVACRGGALSVAPPQARWSWSGPPRDCAAPAAAEAAEAALRAALVGGGAGDAIPALVAAVEAVPPPFDAGALAGDWRLCYQLNGDDATRSQAALSGKPQYSNFLTDAKGRAVFRNLVHVTANRVRVVADVAWSTARTPSGRLASTICAAGLEIGVGRRFGWRPLRIPLPIRGVGWLDVTYVSDGLRVTRGSRGGLFVHCRPNVVGDAYVTPDPRYDRPEFQ